MKILLIMHLVPYPPRGGVMIRNFNLLKEMSKKHEIYLLAFNQATHFATAVELSESKEALSQYCVEMQVFDIPTDRSRLAWVLLLFLNLFSLTPYSAWRFYSNQMVLAVRQQLAQREFDVMEIGTIALARFAKLSLQLPKVLVHHNIESQLLLRRSKVEAGWAGRVYLGLQAWKLRRFESRMSRYIDFHTVCSEDDKTSLMQHCPNSRIVVVPNGVDTDYFTPSEGEVQSASLIYVGGLNWFPNRDAMIFFKNEIWPRLESSIPEVSMTHIGKGSAKDLNNLNDPNKRFTCLGFVDDIRPYVASASIYIVPLRVGGGTRLKILDAMAMGKAIVSTSVGAEGLCVSHGEDIIIADEPIDFADAIMTLIHDDEKRSRLGINARRKVVSKYSWQVIAPKLSDTYADAIMHRELS